MVRENATHELPCSHRSSVMGGRIEHSLLLHADAIFVVMMLQKTDRDAIRFAHGLQVLLEMNDCVQSPVV